MDTPSLNGLVGSLLEPEWEGVSLLINVAYRIEPGLFVFESSIDEYPEDDAAYRSEDFSKYLCNHNHHTPLGIVPFCVCKRYG